MKGQKRIDQVFVFIVLDDDNTEGVPAFQAGAVAMPMVAADPVRVEQLRPIAETIAREMGKKITLAKFTTREDLEVIE